MPPELEKTYSPQSVESQIYALWESLDVFKPEVNAGAAEKFCMVIPPPNVTGTLHMGHALDNTLQDILIRWHRMLGHETLWMPGMDHAGIATQNVVERQLRERGLTKFDLGREAFVQEVWDWALARKQDIMNQFKRLGISPDWNRQRFTLDEGLSKAVREAFVRLYQADLIYQGTYIVNWCPRCTSAISDIETEYTEEDSYLWEISYPLAHQPGALVVATTRPETMFGDVAVAVNPNDPRYKHFIGKTVLLPLANLEIPVIGDEYVDTAFGTGALKITPAHDANDFDIAMRHQLDPVWVIDENGHLKTDVPNNRVPPDIQGLDRAAARQLTEELLTQHGFLIQKTPHKHSVGHCQRCGTTIEPLLSKQWFVRCQPLAEKALISLDKHELQYVPDRWRKIYHDWMSNIRDWCISRQLWWGHQIPAWTCEGCQQIIVAVETPTICPHCQSTELTQETDVLDTWFSSGLWPFSTLGWPDPNAHDYQTFYPTNVLVTGFDIIFFWVARMVILGLQLTEQSPFQTVYIHGLIRDEKGQKMSKSKGNTIDPVEIIDEYGCDALRFSLTSMVTGGQDIKLSKDSFEQGKLFANKLWNASRFVLMNLDGVDDQPIDLNALSTMDQWILAQLAETSATVNAKLMAYRFSDITDTLYEFIWNTFCDWYVEYAKKQLRDEATQANTQRILRYVLDQTLRLLHPVMPHITEAIWQKLPHRDKSSVSIMTFPTKETLLIPADTQAVLTAIDFVLQTIRTTRNIRQICNYPPKEYSSLEVIVSDDEYKILEDNKDIISHFLKIKDNHISRIYSEHINEKVEFIDKAVGVLSSGSYIAISINNIDKGAEENRLSKQLVICKKEYDQLQGMLDNPSFVDRAPAAVVEKNRQRRDELAQQIETLEGQLAALKAS